MRVTQASGRREPAARWRTRTVLATSATRIVVAAFGALVAFAGVAHGIGEILQGPVAPTCRAPDAEFCGPCAGSVVRRRAGAASDSETRSQRPTH